MKRGELEVLIRNEVINIFKSSMGKGPQDTTLKITKNYIILEIVGILMPGEKKLIKLETGHEQVSQMKDSLMDILCQDFIKIIEKILQVKVVDYITKVNVEDNVHRCLFILEDNLEKFIKDSITT